MVTTRLIRLPCFWRGKRCLHHLSLKINILSSLTVLPCTFIFLFLLLFFFFSKLGKAYFDLQPSWFDTPSNNGGCFKVENFPVSAKDLETIRNVKFTSRSFTEQAKGMKKETCKLPFLYSPHLRESSVVLRVTKQLGTQN